MSKGLDSQVPMSTEESPTPRLAPPTPFEQTIVQSRDKCGALGHACCAQLVTLTAERNEFGRALALLSIERERLRAALAGMADLMERALVMVTHGRPTVEQAQAAIDEARALLAGVARP